MAKDGTVVPAAQFTGSGGVGATIADQVRDEDVLRLFADGSTIVLQALLWTWEPVGDKDLAARLGSELGHPVQVKAYITPPQSQGFSAHYDTDHKNVLGDRRTEALADPRTSQQPPGHRLEHRGR